MSNLIAVGRGGAVDADRIVAVARISSAPIKRLLKAAGQARVIDLTYGEPSQTVLVLDNGCLAVVSLPPEAFVQMTDVEQEVTHDRR